MLAGLAIWTLGVSTLTAILFVYDKQAAIRKWRRIPEKTLLGCCLVGGWPGGLLASQWIRHKTQKMSFRVSFWVCAILHLGAATFFAFTQR
jgi:uncharacterized membrane protein YsdA (DUF1294 family)